jgi:predicted transcriptional regulator
MAEVDEQLITLTADIVSAHVSNNNVPVNDLPTLIASVHGALVKLGNPVEPAIEKQEPAVAVRSSIKPDYIVSLESGKKLKMLRRYLKTHYNMTPEDYRKKWNLPSDYPMVAPNYAEQRRSLAHSIGLGRKPKTDGASSPGADKKEPRRRVVKPTGNSTPEA